MTTRRPNLPRPSKRRRFKRRGFNNKKATPHTLIARLRRLGHPVPPELADARKAYNRESRNRCYKTHKCQTLDAGMFRSRVSYLLTYHVCLGVAYPYEP